MCWKSTRKVICLFLFAAGVASATPTPTPTPPALIFNQKTIFTTGASLTISSGVALLGTWDFTAADAVLGVPPPTIAITGDATGTGTTSIALSLKNLPDLVAAPGSILSTNILAPVAPASGKIKWFSSTTDKRFHDRNDTGSTGTTVVAATPQPFLVVTAISTAGVITQTYPIFPDSDPHVAGAGYWSGGVLHRSLGTPTPTPTPTP